jgi:outer membrane protein OmpA-like peptidoglycan-associated protein
MSFCSNCGTQIVEGQQFCSNCGTAAGAGPVVPTAPLQVDRSGTALQVPPAVSPQAPPAKSSGSKILIVILLILFFGGAAVVGGVIYVGYRVKQKATAALSNLENDGNKKSSSSKGSSGNSDGSHAGNNDGSPEGGGGKDDNPLSAVLGKLQGSEGGSGGSTPMGNMAKNIFEDLGAKNPDMPQDLVRNIPYSALTSPLPCPTTDKQIDAAKLANGRILFKPGTILTSSWSLPLADAEGDNIIHSVTPAGLVFEHIGVAALGLDMAVKTKADINSTVCGKDIAEGEAYSTGWVFKSTQEPIAPGLYPGVSRLLLPTGKFNELKSSGSTKLVFAWYDYMDALTEWELIAWKGILTRVEPDDVPFPLIINDERVNVPSIHVRANMQVIESGGRFGPRDQPADAYILDDPNTPVMLSWMMGKDMHQDDSFKVQFVRVTYPSDKPTIEQELAKNRKAITWGINFDFNSDTIRPVSEPVLKEIAQAMADRPDWKLTVTGHTDNIGGHKYNLDLSQRRAAAVKKALVERYRVDGNRLSTGGDGDSDPIDTNDTLEGRARNRRVELTLD